MFRTLFFGFVGFVKTYLDYCARGVSSSLKAIDKKTRTTAAVPTGEGAQY